MVSLSRDYGLLAKDSIKPGPPAGMSLGLCSLHFMEPYKVLVTFLGYVYVESGLAQAPIQDVVPRAQPDMHYPQNCFAVIYLKYFFSNVSGCLNTDPFFSLH